MAVHLVSGKARALQKNLEAPAMRQHTRRCAGQVLHTQGGASVRKVLSAKETGATMTTTTTTPHLQQERHHRQETDGIPTR